MCTNFVHCFFQYVCMVCLQNIGQWLLMLCLIPVSKVIVPKIWILFYSNLATLIMYNLTKMMIMRRKLCLPNVNHLLSISHAPPEFIVTEENIATYIAGYIARKHSRNSNAITGSLELEIL